MKMKKKKWNETKRNELNEQTQRDKNLNYFVVTWLGHYAGIIGGSICRWLHLPSSSDALTLPFAGLSLFGWLLSSLIMTSFVLALVRNWNTWRCHSYTFCVSGSSEPSRAAPPQDPPTQQLTLASVKCRYFVCQLDFGHIANWPCGCSVEGRLPTLANVIPLALPKHFGDN